MKTLKEVMSTDVCCLSPESSLSEVAAKMKELDVGSIPICENERLVGMVTDRDIVTKALVDQEKMDTQAREVMTSPIIYCFEDQDVGEAARIMEVKQIRRLVVLDRTKKLVGIVSLGDLSVRSGNEELIQEVTEEVSRPEGSGKTEAA